MIFENIKRLISGKPMPAIEPPLERPVPPERISIKITDIPEDAPDFKREYRGALANGIQVRVTAYQWTLGVMLSGELTQKNGRWVLFDPERVADRILDPALVPLVNEFCQEAIRLDKAFRASAPKSFVDEKGFTWTRA